MMKLAAERAASIGGTVATPPGLNESDFQEELSCLQAGETNGGLGTVEGTRQAGLVRSGFWQSTGTETERGTSTAATQLYPFSYTDASVSRANGEDSWSMERPLLAQDQSAKSSFDFSDALTPLDDTREIQVTHTGDTYSKRRRLIYENYGTFFFWLLSKVGI